MAKRSGDQYRLFDTATALPSGLVYRPEFITPAEEETLLAHIRELPFENAFDGTGTYEARRRVAHFGWGYDFEKERLVPGGSLPHFLSLYQKRIAKWLDIPVRRVAEALVTEYRPGTALGWHRDNENFEHVVGLSLAGWCRIRFRPIVRRPAKYDAKDVVSLELEPRSIYIMQNDVRWKYQHSVAKTEALRYSITFRTLPKDFETKKR